MCGGGWLPYRISWLDALSRLFLFCGFRLPPPPSESPLKSSLLGAGRAEGPPAAEARAHHGAPPTGKKAAAALRALGGLPCETERDSRQYWEGTQVTDDHYLLFTVVFGVPHVAQQDRAGDGATNLVLP